MKMPHALRSIRFSAFIFVAFMMSVSASLYAQGTSTDVGKFHKFIPAKLPGQADSALNQSTGTDQPSQVTAQQIGALEQEKSSRNAAQKKIDSNVLYTMRMLSGQSAAPGVPYLNTDVDLDEGNNIVVDITAQVSNQLLQKLASAGVTVLYSSVQYHSIRAIVPPAQMETIAAFAEVHFISRMAESMTEGRKLSRGNALLGSVMGFDHRAQILRQRLSALLPMDAGLNIVAGSPGTPIYGQGSVESQSDITHRAYDARGAFGINGAGLKIGVLSDSVNNTGALTSGQASGDLPPTCGVGVPAACMTVVQDLSSGGSDEGAAMLEIVHDMVPGAALYFATADTSEAGFASNIQALRTAGCDIIVDDVFYFDEPVFEDGIVAQAVTTVVTGGALYFSSAGNEGNVDSSTAGYFEGDFNDTGSPAFTFPGGAKTGTIHNFGTVATPVNGDIITSTGEAYTLQWADPQGASTNDYDLFLVSSTGTVKASSTNIQSGTQNPFEQISPLALAAGDRLVVFKTAAASSVFFAINTLRGTLTLVTAGQTHGHSAATAAYSVAATPSAAAFSTGYPAGPFPGPFTSSDSVELFSSDGPRRVFFNTDGSAITPGNFSSTGGTVRNKPDITAGDGVNTTLPSGSGLNPFYGTSAAAPAAASVAALVKSAKPSITQGEMQTALTSTAIDIMSAGYDRDSGFGIVMAYQAVNSLGVTGFANPELGIITATENPGDGDGVIEPGEGAKLVIQLSNANGVLDATGVTAALTTSTAGVTITQPNTSAYANLAAGSGVGNNLTAFTFTLASNAQCGLVIDFVLTVTYNSGQQRVLPFTVTSGMVTISNSLGSVASVPTGVTASTGMQTNRISRNGVTSVCGTPKAFPGTVTTTGSRAYDAYSFTACQATCLQPVMSSANGVNLFESIYAGAFNPASISTNYAADSGLSGDTQTCGLSVTSSNAYTIVVSDVPGTSVGSNYTLQIPACIFHCNANQVPIALVHDVTVTAATVGGTANASIDNGSNDPDGDPVTITQTPPGPYSVGVTSVMLTITDSKGATAQATANVTVLNPNVNAPDLTISKTHTGNFGKGQTGATYSITVNNVGTAASSGLVTVVDTLPSDLTATAIAGSGWICTLGTLTCTRTDALAAAASYPVITLTVNVSSTAASSVTNTATVSGGGETNTANDSASDVTTIVVSSFTITTALSSVMVRAGQSATDSIMLTPNPVTASEVDFSCSNLPAFTSCSFSPSSVPPGSTPVSVMMTITTTAPHSVALQHQQNFYASWWLSSSGLGLIGMLFIGARRRNRKAATIMLAGALLLMLALAGCGDHHLTDGTPVGSYTMRVTAQSGAVSSSSTFTVVVE